ncbi:MAG: hypothetical protein AB1592_04715 [Pseudomonadota bacterium]
MDSALRLILRLLLIPTGVIVAAFVQAMIVLFGQWQIDAVVARIRDPQDAMAFSGAVLLAGFLTAAYLALVWTIGAIGILFSEAFAVRSWLFHLANGALSAFVAVQVFPALMDEPAPLEDRFYILAAGFAGGLVYWLIAGWSAGFWKSVLTPPRAPAP